MTNLIAVCLALGLSRLPILLKALYLGLHKRWRQPCNADPQADVVDSAHLEALGENPADNQPETPPPAAAASALEQDEQQQRQLFPFSSIEDGFARVGRNIFRGRIEVGRNDRGIRRLARRIAQNAREDSSQFSLALIFAILLTGLFVSEQTLAILSANIVTGSEVLSAHPECGRWVLDWDALGDWTTGEILNTRHQTNRELKALNYAEKCYGVEDGIENCNILANRKIDYVMQRNTSCPFPGDVCKTEALVMDTGFQPFSKVGLNVPIHGSFRRKLACAPLTDRFSHIRQTGRNSSYVEYELGYRPEGINHSQSPVLWSHPFNDNSIRQGEHKVE